MTRVHVFASLILLVLGCRAAPPPEIAHSSFEDLSDPFFGQTPPRDEARVFMPYLISTHGRDGNISFLDDGEFCVFTSDETGTRFTSLENGRWTTPRPVP